MALKKPLTITAGQIQQLQAGDLLDPADVQNVVTAAAVFGTDNTVLRADGTGKGSQTSPVSIDDAGRCTLNSANYTILVGSGSGGAFSGTDNVLIGVNCGNASTFAGQNVGIGVSSLRDTIGGGADNVALGALAIFSASVRNNNMAIGSQALRDVTALDHNVGIGVQSLFNSSIGSGNFGLGQSAGAGAILVNNNVCMGPNAGVSSNLNSANVFIGPGAAQDSTLEHNNVGIGESALRSTLGDGSFNIGIGLVSFFLTTIGSDNIGIGRGTGRSLANVLASENIFIGANSGNSGSQLNSATNSVAIGSGTFTTVSNTGVLGNTSMTAWTMNGGLTVNEQGLDADTRIEGDTLTHMLFCDASAATENIALLASAAPNWQSMDGGLFIANGTTIPSGNPVGGGFLYVEAGALKWRGSAGTVTTLGAA